MLRGDATLTTCSSTTALPTQRTNVPSWPKMTTAIQTFGNQRCPHQAWHNKHWFCLMWPQCRLQFGISIQSDDKKINKKKHVSFATHNEVHQYTNNEQHIMVTYDSGADGHYINNKHQRKAGLPILRQSTWQGWSRQWRHKQSKICLTKIIEHTTQETPQTKMSALYWTGGGMSIKRVINSSTKKQPNKQGHKRVDCLKIEKRHKWVTYLIKQQELTITDTYNKDRLRRIKN